MRLFESGSPTHDIFIENNIAGAWLQSRSPTRTLRQLGVCLRDFHREVREILPIQEIWHDPACDEKNRLLTRQREGLERIEILLIAAFTLLRRLADEMINASRPFLFEHWQSAPGLMKVAISRAREGKLRSCGPICDIDILEGALHNRTAWFERLRQEDGLRDILIHKPHILQVSFQGTQTDESIDWRLTAHVVRGVPGQGSGITFVDLIPELLECICGACKFMEDLVRVVGVLHEYNDGDVLFLSGFDNDIIGCWPGIFGGPVCFPIC
jgi:hypothetical protein